MHVQEKRVYRTVRTVSYTHLIMINDKPIISHCLVTFNNNENIDGIVIVCSPEYRDFLSDWIGKLNIDKFMNFADPGENRQYSIINALDTLEECNPENVITVSYTHLIFSYCCF